MKTVLKPVLGPAKDDAVTLPPPRYSKKQVLVLGMSHPCMEGQIRRFYKSRPQSKVLEDPTVNETRPHSTSEKCVQDINNRSMIPASWDIRFPSWKAAVECVGRGILTEMDGRDLARCQATEEVAQANVFTVSQENAAVYDSGRHMYANFNRGNFCQSLKRTFGDEVRFHQIILDYFWIPSGWDVQHWSRNFFLKTLTDFARIDLLETTNTTISNHVEIKSRLTLVRSVTRAHRKDFNLQQQKQEKQRELEALNNVGVVYLPFCYHCFKGVVSCLDILSEFYAISFVRKQELSEVSLWAGTQVIDPLLMKKILGKRINQEDIYCTFSIQDVRQALDDPTVSKDTLLWVLHQIEDFPDIRMIKLQSLRVNIPTGRSHSSKCNRAIGGLQGLVEASRVKRGFSDSSKHIIRSASVVPQTDSHCGLQSAHGVLLSTPRVVSPSPPPPSGKRKNNDRVVQRAIKKTRAPPLRSCRRLKLSTVPSHQLYKHDLPDEIITEGKGKWICLDQSSVSILPKQQQQDLHSRLGKSKEPLFSCGSRKASAETSQEMDSDDLSTPSLVQETMAAI